MFFCRHRESVTQAFRALAAYMPGKASGAALDPYTSSVQWSRRFIGLKLFFNFAVNGASGQAEMIEHQTRMGQVLKSALSDSGWHILNSTLLPLVCFTRDGLDVPEFLDGLRNRQIAWMSEAQIKGVSVVRACVTSYRTTESEVRWVVEEMNRLVAGKSEAWLTPAEY
jgi:glutamate/tyrosine decarboxylase-like PLP-dependent enzyme